MQQRPRALEMLEHAAAYEREGARCCPVRRTTVRRSQIVVDLLSLQHVCDDEPDRVFANAEERQTYGRERASTRCAAASR